MERIKKKKKEKAVGFRGKCNIGEKINFIFLLAVSLRRGKQHEDEE